MTAAVAAGLVVVALMLLWSAWQTPRRPLPPVSPRAPRRTRVSRAYRYRTHYGYHYLHATPGAGRRYIGIGVDPAARDRFHIQKWWYPSTTRRQYVVAQFPDWWAARSWEREQILTAYNNGEPIANGEHVPGARARRRVRA